MLKEAIEKIETMSRPQIVSLANTDYVIASDGTYMTLRPELDLPLKKEIQSLDALVTMVKLEALSRWPMVYINIPTHLRADVFLPLNEKKRESRTTLYTAFATDVPGWEPETKLPFEKAAIALQTRFQDSEDREYTLRLLSQITTGAKVTYNDIGVATTVVTQKGVSLQQNTTIRPLVKLRPYRTFQEVEQPEGLFLIRIDERGITFIEADGGMWKLTARQTVYEYLKKALDQEINDRKVALML